MTDPERTDSNPNSPDGSGPSEAVPGREVVDHSEAIEARRALQEEREREWEEVLLYEALVRGPDRAEETPWEKTLDNFAAHLEDNARVLLDHLYDFDPVDEDKWDEERNNRYLEN